MVFEIKRAVRLGMCLKVARRSDDRHRLPVLAGHGHGPDRDVFGYGGGHELLRRRHGDLVGGQSGDRYIAIVNYDDPARRKLMLAALGGR